MMSRRTSAATVHPFTSMVAAAEALEGRRLFAAGGAEHLVRHAVADIVPAAGLHVSGKVQFHETRNGLVVDVHVRGLAPGPHGFHVHQNGVCDPNSTPPFASAGPHYNPTGEPHGSPDAPDHHLGDFGNLVADAKGRVHTRFLANPDVSLNGPSAILNRALIVHADADDLHTQPTGNSGGRVACGVIEARGRGADGPAPAAAAAAAFSSAPITAPAQGRLADALFAED
jgi:superoxide dismutase, Cu-Zn family